MKNLTLEKKINIYLFRNKKVMLDNELAELYGVPTKALNLAVKRNKNRFPHDFMFRLNKEEFKNLRFQFETSSSTHHGGRRSFPCVFTQEGVAMLSSVIHSPKAILANIAIMRTFIKMREIIHVNKELMNELMNSKLVTIRSLPQFLKPYEK